MTVRVLVVDDEAGIRTAIKRAIENVRERFDGIDEEIIYETVLAEDGDACLKHLSDGLGDIVLLDYKLPGVDGLEILRRLGQMKHDGVVVMMTAYASLETASDTTKLGAYDFLAKPFTLDEMRYSLRKATQHLVLRRQAEQLAAEKKQVRFQFISVLAHELKSPLGAVEGYLRIIKDQVAGDTIEAYSDVVDRSLVRLEGMRKLIFDLLELTRLESGQKERDLRQIDLNEIVAYCAESVQTQAAERGIHLSVKVADGLKMFGDRTELEIIFNNLLTNAVKYNRDSGSVTLKVGAKAGKISITCADTGIGMKPEEVDRLFGEFVRIKNEKTKHITGSGLGLSILKKIVSLYDGSISVKSIPAEKTTFTVKLTQGDVP